MKIFAFGVFLVALAFPVYAQDISALPQGGNEQDQALEAWNAADTDGDGRISRAEAIAANPDLAEIFDMIDTDGDGYITPEENRAAMLVTFEAPEG